MMTNPTVTVFLSLLGFFAFGLFSRAQKGVAPAPKRRPFPLRFRLKLQSRLNLQSLKQPR